MNQDYGLFDFPPQPEPPEPHREVVHYQSSNIHNAVDDALPHLGASGLVFQRKSHLVQVLYQHETLLTDSVSSVDTAPVIHYVTPPHLVEILCRCTLWMKYDGRSKDWVPCTPPRAVAMAIHGRGLWEHVPDLRGVSTVPILREDGSLHMEAGYDEESGIFYAPDGTRPVVPGAPTRDDAQNAAIELLGIVQDFPFVEPYHRSVWLSTVLAGVARPVIDGGVPMTVIDANKPGTGKSLLVDVASMLAWGAVAPKSPPPREEDELKKVITSHLLAGDLVCCFDNMPPGKPVGWPVLDAALTAGIWSDRELGRNNRLRLPMSAMWFVTGNNLSVCADSSRRTLRIRLEAPEARPELRSGFKWNPILQEIRFQRPFLLGKALNIVRAYLQAGRPDVGVQPLGGFESWSEVVRNAVIWIGMPDPCEGLASNEVDVDEDHDARCTLLAKWPKDVSGPLELTANEFLKRIEASRDHFQDVIDALGILCPTRDGSLPNTRRLGHALRAVLDARFEIGSEVLCLRRRMIQGIRRYHVKSYQP